MVPELPADTSSTPSLIIAGALADVVEDQFQRLFEQLGVGPVRFFPCTQCSGNAPNWFEYEISPGAAFLAETGRLLEERGAQHIPAPFPLGVEGTTAWLKAAADAWNIDAVKFESIIEMPRARAEKSLEHYRATLTGKASFLFPGLNNWKFRWRGFYRANWALP